MRWFQVRFVRCTAPFVYSIPGFKTAFSGGGRVPSSGPLFVALRMPALNFPTPEHYETDLQVFREHGFRVWFAQDPAAAQVRFCGQHVAVAFDWTRQLPRQALEYPEYIPAFLQQAWGTVKEELERTYRFPALVHWVAPREAVAVYDWQHLQQVLHTEQRVEIADVQDWAWRESNGLSLVSEASWCAQAVVEGDQFRVCDTAEVGTVVCLPEGWRRRLKNGSRKMLAALGNAVFRGNTRYQGRE